MVMKADKEECGVGIQNFKYAPEFEEMMQIVNLYSPSAYQYLSGEIAVPTQRSIR